MLKRYLRLDTIFILLITLVIIILLTQSRGSTHLPPSDASANQANPLTVSQDGSQTTTNVSGGDLQSAAPPAASTTNASLSPQQAVPYAAQ